MWFSCVSADESQDGKSLEGQYRNLERTNPGNDAQVSQGGLFGTLVECPRFCWKADVPEAAQLFAASHCQPFSTQPVPGTCPTVLR